MKPGNHCPKLKSMRNCVVVALLFLLSPSFGQTVNPNWKPELEKSLQQFLSCKAPDDCNKFIGEAISTVYKISDFEKGGKYMSFNEINDLVSSKWTVLGHVYEQKALEEAQNYANAKKAVIAVYKNAAGYGHIAIILPGELQTSGSWGLKVPNSSSFFINTPERSYVDKGLSYAFGKELIKDVLIYGRKY